MKNIALLLVILISLCISKYASAQSVSIGARGGISIPNLTNGGNGTPLSRGYSSRRAADFAVFAEFQVSDLFSIRPIIEYSQQGGKKNGFQALTTPEQLASFTNQAYVYADYNSTAKMNYLMIPVLAKFGWNPGPQSPLRLYADAGPFFGYLLSAHQVTSGNSLIYLDPAGKQALPLPPTSFDNNQNIRDELHHINIGISGNLGLAFHFDSGAIFIEGGGNYGFLNIQKNAINGKNHTGAATVAVGYAYRLGR